MHNSTNSIPQTVPQANSSHSNLTPATSTRAIEVLSIERGETTGVLAVVTVRVGGILLRGVRVTNRGRGTFVNFPSRKIDGTWRDLVQIVSPALRSAVVECILLAVRKMEGAQ